MAIYEFINQVLIQLKESEELKDITFLSEFPSSEKPVPLKRLRRHLAERKFQFHPEQWEISTTQETEKTPK